METEVITPSSSLGSKSQTEAKPQEQDGGSCNKLPASESCPPAPQYGHDYLKAREYQP